MKKSLLVRLIAIIFITAVILIPVYLRGKDLSIRIFRSGRSAGAQDDKKGYFNQSIEISKACELLKIRKDKEAAVIFDRIISEGSDNLDALWGKAEILRRVNDFDQSEAVLNKVLIANPKHLSSLNSLAYIRYKQGRLDEAESLLNNVFKSPLSDKDNKALAYLLLGSINSSRCEKGGVIGKLKYGTKIKKYFLKAKELSPDLPEVHLGLGSFYLLAPKIIGGDLDKAIEELQTAVNMASDFATANARLAQGYKMKGMEYKYQFYIDKAKQIEPQNFVLKELE